MIPQPDPPIPVIQTQQYTAEPGDTVSKMAQKFFGSKNPANINLILKVNPDLAANPHKVVVSQKYNIPVAPASTENTSGANVTPRPAPAPAPVPAPTPDTGGSRAGAGPETTYTTKPNDTLWGIASRECGSGSMNMVNQIKELNKDVLNGKDLVRPNMKLRLPPRANNSSGNGATASTSPN